MGTVLHQVQPPTSTPHPPPRPASASPEATCYQTRLSKEQTREKKQEKKKREKKEREKRRRNKSSQEIKTEKTAGTTSAPKETENKYKLRGGEEREKEIVMDGYMLMNKKEKKEKEKKKYKLRRCQPKKPPLTTSKEADTNGTPYFCCSRSRTCPGSSGRRCPTSSRMTAGPAWPELGGACPLLYTWRGGRLGSGMKR